MRAPDLAPAVRRGNSVFGPLRIDWQVTSDGFAFDVKLFLSNQPVDHALLTRQEPNHRFDVKSGITSAAGMLSAQFGTAGQSEKLSGDFDYCIQKECQHYQGIIAMVVAGVESGNESVHDEA